jgi:hypothetical protein
MGGGIFLKQKTGGGIWRSKRNAFSRRKKSKTIKTENLRPRTTAALQQHQKQKATKS